jgi:hypothetical protein
LLTVILAYSDCIEVSEHTETHLIEYSNENDFGGIIYNITPSPVFGIRVHSKFFKERYPEENESEELSNGTTVKLSGDVKIQRLLQVEPMPFYMHKKMKFALQHNYVTVDGEEFTKEDQYEVTELNEKYPLHKAEVWLTQKEDGYFTNVYGEISEGS